MQRAGELVVPIKAKRISREQFLELYSVGLPVMWDYPSNRITNNHLQIHYPRHLADGKLAEDGALHMYGKPPTEWGDHTAYFTFVESE